jgi:hypothetical protein
MTSVNKLNIISIYTWSIGPNGFEELFTVGQNEENIIELINNMKRRQKYDEFVFITKEGKSSKARDLYIVEEYSNYHKPNTNGNEYINYTKFRFRCKKFSTTE